VCSVPVYFSAFAGTSESWEVNRHTAHYIYSGSDLAAYNLNGVWLTAKKLRLTPPYISTRLACSTVPTACS